MTVTLALLEVGSLFAVVFGILIVWMKPVMTSWLDMGSVLTQAIAVSLCCILSFYYNDLYDLRIVRNLGEFIPRLIKSLILALMLLAAFDILFPQAQISGEQFVLSLFVIAALILPLRAACYSMLSKRLFSQRVLILGTGSLAWKIGDELNSAPFLRCSVLGYLDENNGHERRLPPGRGVPADAVYGPLERIEEAVKELRPDRIVVALAERRRRLPVWGLLSSRLNGVVVEDGAEFYETIMRKLAIESLNPSFLLYSKDFDKPKVQLAFRRLVSLAVAAIGLVVSVPLMLAAAILIKLGSEGPVFFVQERTGRGGRVFRLIKFRTMSQAVPEERPSVWNRENDEERLTRIGTWLRALRFDELPQFINVLRGDMDLVGPRPEMACNVETMTEQIPYYSIRHVVRPGVTGWAQVKHGYSVSKSDVMEKVRYDLYYIKHMSLWFDLRIMFDTVKIVLFTRGT